MYLGEGDNFFNSLKLLRVFALDCVSTKHPLSIP